MAVPIIIGDHVFGVINLEHSKPNAFEEEDEKVIEALASQASLAIDNVQTYIELENQLNELRQHKGFVGSQTTVKWMKMILEGLNHSISGEAGKALVGIRLSRDALLEEDIPRALEELENIKNPINEIKNVPMEEPLSSDGVVKSIPINTVLREYMDTLWMHPGYAAVQLNLSDIDDRTKPTVRASKAWLRQLFKILADNAVQAMTTHDTLQKILTIQSHTMGSEIEILFEDTGPGIPNELKETLFEKRIYKKKGESGMGIGLVLARTVIEAYEGNIRLLNSPAGGTSIMVTLPVENNE